MDKYVITGGAGFIGSHIANELNELGHEVIVLDNLRTGFKKNIEELDVKFVQGDVLDENLLYELAKGAKGIFHLAAMVSVPESLKNLEDCININVKGTLNVLEAAKKNPECKVVLSSSAAIYGSNPTLPKFENMLPEPMTPYAVTKLDGEYYLKIYKEQWDVATASLRYFNVFGPRQNPNSTYAAAVPIFIHQALLNEPLTIHGDGNQTRDFVYVKDVVNANIYAMEKGNGVFNVAFGQSISILDLANRIIELTNSKSRLEFAKKRPGDIVHSKASIEKFKYEGFEPKWDLDKALNDTIAFYRIILRKNKI
ncbi:SDR family NAD(P)-dependent oxidoreductase [Muricauda sp. SCSIO 64092]|uniref:SDR family NAD(P)-dependent oxidoreductase n=1 Tax=Allomuricauda sp. SCSIO 64092 TaxID=2908842 RepID=UPI001FF218D5|nr:SDR family NAD(P)-dependent oxidoreductase [Muricauda sp. SCSIO 64092]UOY04876.1 SDR family NAD(P)-dependent oxidoreductase [Muricauda sp. SCSIO 64092]